MLYNSREGDHGRSRERERERYLEVVKFGKASLALRVHHHNRPYHLLLSTPPKQQWGPILNRTGYITLYR